MVKRLGVIVWMLALVTACAAGAAPTPITFDEPLPHDPGPDVGGPALQAAIFADGMVNHAEYERAFTAAIDCMRNEGFDVEGPLTYPDGALVISPGMDPTLRLTLLAHNVPAAEDARWSEVNGRCLAQWSYAVERVYLDAFAPSEAEIAAWYERAWACMREQGIELSDPPTDAEGLDSVSYGCRPWE